MSWKRGDWFTAVDRARLYDGAGDIGPSVWWNGELIGSWASTPTGIRVRIVADRGRTAAEAVDGAAGRLRRRIGITVVTPAARTPLERELAA